MTTTLREGPVWPLCNSPEIERLTPDRTLGDDEALDPSEALTAASFLRLPLVLIELLNIPSELVSTDAMRSLLTGRPDLDRYKLLELLKKLYHCCNSLCLDGYQTPRDTPALCFKHGDIDSNNRLDRAFDERPISLNYQPGNIVKSVEVGDYDDEVGFTQESLEYQLDSEEHINATTPQLWDDIAHGTSGIFRNNESKTTSFNGDNPTTLTSPRDSPTSIVESTPFLESPDKAVESTPLRDSPASTVESTPFLESLEDSVKLTPLRDLSDSPAEVTSLGESSKNSTANVPNKPNQATAKDSSIVDSMIEQSAIEFAASSLDEVEKLQFPMESMETYKSLLEYLKQSRQIQTKWSSGFEWKAMLESGFAERNKSSIRYALTAIAFSRWHRDQAQLLALPSYSSAVQEVSSRFLGPVPDNASDKRVREARRKWLTTHLSRGRSWDELVSVLGFGILFKNAWGLAKTKKHIVKDFICQLQHDSQKMRVLRLLEWQISLLLDNGRTDSAVFRQALMSEGLLSASKRPIDITNGIITLQNKMKLLAPNQMLQIKNTTFSFNIKTISRLAGVKWFNDELILLCLHLADRLSHIRIGFSIPIHQENDPYKIVTKPFEKAAKAIEEWRNAEPGSPLVCLFPLFQRGDHFSLLEVNFRELKIYHYDSLRNQTHTGIQEACRDQFPELQYSEQVTPQQQDTSSCGPLVVTSSHARMLDRAVIPGNVILQDVMAIRLNAFDTISSAWYDGVMVPAENSNNRKRRGESINGNEKKRWRLDLN